MQSCGTYIVSWMDDSLPDIGDPPLVVTIYFASAGWGGDYSKQYATTAKIVACPAGGDTMYLYYLYPTDYCTVAYCAM